MYKLRNIRIKKNKQTYTNFCKKIMFQNIKPRCRYLCVSNIISDEHSGSLVCDSCGLVAEDRVLDVGVEWPTFSVDGWANSTKLSLDPTCGSIISSMGRTTKYRQKLRYLSQYQKSNHPYSWGISPSKSRLLNLNATTADTAATAEHFTTADSIMTQPQQVYKKSSHYVRKIPKFLNSVSNPTTALTNNPPIPPQPQDQLDIIQPNMQTPQQQQQQQSQRQKIASRRGVKNVDTQIFKFIREIADRISGGESIINIAYSVYNQAIACVRGVHQPMCVAAACVYVACIEEEVPRVFAEISAICDGVTEKKISRCYNVMVDHLKQSQHPINTGPISASLMLSRYCTNLDFGLGFTSTHAIKCRIEVQKLADENVLLAEFRGVAANRSANCVAAAAILLAAKCLPSDTGNMVIQLHNVTKAAPNTIRQAAKIILELQTIEKNNT